MYKLSRKYYILTISAYIFFQNIYNIQFTIFSMCIYHYLTHIIFRKYVTKFLKTEKAHKNR